MKERKVKKLVVDGPDGSGGYEVECPHCKESFRVEGLYPEYCAACGEELQGEKA